MCMMKSMKVIYISGTEYKNNHEKHVSKNVKQTLAIPNFMVQFCQHTFHPSSIHTNLLAFHYLKSKRWWHLTEKKKRNKNKKKKGGKTKQN